MLTLILGSGVRISNAADTAQVEYRSKFPSVYYSNEKDIVESRVGDVTYTLIVKFGESWV